MNNDTQQITQDQLVFGHTIRDAPATCLIMLSLAGAQAREVWLARVIGYSDKTVHSAMETLDVLGLAARIGQHKSWVLTNKAHQLTTGIQNTEQVRVLSSSSSLIDIDVLSSSSLKLQLQPTQNTEQVRVLRPTYALLIPYFLDRIGPANKALENALHHAADAGDDPANIATLIEEWSAYLGSEKAKGIQNPGAFVAKMITNAQNTPDWFSAWLTRERGPKHFGHDWREWLAENGYCVRCASDPCQCETSEGQHESVTNL